MKSEIKPQPIDIGRAPEFDLENTPLTQLFEWFLIDQRGRGPLVTIAIGFVIKSVVFGDWRLVGCNVFVAEQVVDELLGDAGVVVTANELLA